MAAGMQAGKSARVGALAVLSACFIASALIRAGDVVAALPGAVDGGPGTPSDAAERVAGAAEGAGEVTIKAPESVIEELRHQRELLEARAAKQEARQRTLDALEHKLRERLDEIRQARARLAETAALVDDAAGKDVRRLAVLYQQMKPRQAGQIFDRMAPSFAAGFIAEMRPDAAALIMANMDAEKAYAVSLLLAGRNLERPDAPPDAGEPTAAAGE